MVKINTMWKYYIPYMKMRGYLEQLLGSRTSISVLRALIRHRGKIFTVRGLASDAGISHPGASEAVGMLDNLGVVRIQPVGKAYQISLNGKSHILRKIIMPMFAAEERTLDEMIRVLKKRLDIEENISAAVFGSIAKGQEKDDSDVDVLVISDNFDSAISAASDAGEEVFAKFHSSVSPLVFSEREFRSRQRSDLVRSVLDNHIMIHGRNLKDLLK